MISGNNALLTVKNLSKSFSGVKALTKIDFELKNNELHCIVGENGAGKSTFIKILSGAYKPDHGDIFLGNNHFNYLTPNITKKFGISTVYQENLLVPHMTVAENIFIGCENVNKFGLISYKRTYKQALKLIKYLSINLKVYELVQNLSATEQQFIKILKALVIKPKILIMDEPTAMLDLKNTNILLNIIQGLKKDGIGIIYISHHLEEIIKIADKVTVLRDGYLVNSHDKRKEKITMEVLANEMVGRPVDTFYKRKKSVLGQVILEVKNLVPYKTNKEVSFNLRKGEILGIAGMVGSGRSEIVRAIFGADRKKKGQVFYLGKNITPNNPNASVSWGIGMLTEDRQNNGLSLYRSVKENISIVGLEMLGRFVINFRKELKLVQYFVNKLNIKTPSLNQEVIFLSGGNQQKVVLAKWLFKDIDILIIDEPTRGIDVNTKVEIYKIISELTNTGKSIIMVSSEMPELISISDRILIIKNGEISAELKGSEINENNILINSIGRNNERI